MNPWPSCRALWGCGTQVCPWTSTQLPQCLDYWHPNTKWSLQVMFKNPNVMLKIHFILTGSHCLFSRVIKHRFQIRPFPFPSFSSTRCRSKNCEPGLQRSSNVIQSNHLSDARVMNYHLLAIQLMTESLQWRESHFAPKHHCLTVISFAEFNSAFLQLPD